MTTKPYPTHLPRGVARLLRGPRGESSLARKEALSFYLMISPWAIGFVLLTLGPMLASIYISFQEWPLGRPTYFVGVSHYARFLKDQVWLKSLRVTVSYTLGAVPLNMILAFMVALMLNQRVPAVNMFRTVFYLPTLIPATASAILWLFILHPQIGLINLSLRLVGIQGPPWLGSTKWALPGLIVMSLWGVGGAMVLYLAGLQGVPEYLYDAAKIDGANTLRQFWYVTVPIMTPVIFFNLVTSIIGSFQAFNQAYLMTEGGPAQATYFYVLYIYYTAFHYYSMGYGCALSWFLFVVILLLTLLNFSLSKHWVYYEV